MAVVDFVWLMSLLSIIAPRWNGALRAPFDLHAPRSFVVSRAAFATLAPLAAVLLAAGCAPTTDVAGPVGAAGGGRECFSARSANGFTAIDRDTVHVRAGVNDVYELKLAGVCPDVDWTNSVGIRTRGGGDFICRGFDAELIVPRGLAGGPDVCAVRSVRKLPDPAAIPPA